jgi:hypothetical protein
MTVKYYFTAVHYSKIIIWKNLPDDELIRSKQEEEATFINYEPVQKNAEI